MYIPKIWVCGLNDTNGCTTFTMAESVAPFSRCWWCWCWAIAISHLKGNIGCKSNFFLGCKRSTSNANPLKYPTNVYPGKAMPTLMWIPYCNWPINSSKTRFVQSITGCTMDIRIFQPISSKFKGLPWLNVHPHSWTSKFTHGLDHVEPLLLWEKLQF